MITHSQNTMVGFSPWMGPWAMLSPSRTLSLTPVSAASAPLALSCAPSLAAHNCSHLPLDSVTEEQSCPGEQGTGQCGEDTLFPSLLFFPLCYAVPVNLGAASIIYSTRGIGSHSWQRLDLAAPWHWPGAGRRDWILPKHPLCQGGSEAPDHQILTFPKPPHCPEYLLHTASPRTSATVSEPTQVCQLLKCHRPPLAPTHSPVLLKEGKSSISDRGH